MSPRAALSSSDLIFQPSDHRGKTLSSAPFPSLMTGSTGKVEILYFLMLMVGLLASWQHINLVRGNDCRRQEEYASSLVPVISKVFSNSSDIVIEERDGELFLNGIVVRAFLEWPKETPLPCGQYSDPERWWHTKIMRSPTKEGYLFMKEMKTGSSTIGGVALRIARNVAKEQGQPFMCVARVDHSPARDLEFFDRDRNKSFLFTVLRNPQKRITSQFFHFYVSRQKKEPTDANFREFVTSMPYMCDYYLKDLALIEPSDDKMRKLVHNYNPWRMLDGPLRNLRTNLANGIIRGYDFIGITERLDESLVALMMILRLKISDIIYIKAKSSGSFDDGAFNGTCSYIIPSFVSPGMKSFFKTEAYINRTQGDWMLYEAAVKSLDLTIDQLGRDQVERHLLEFRAAQKMAHDQCSTSIRYPCSEGGQRAPYASHYAPHAHDCLWLDSACGYECLDSISPAIEKMIEEGDF